jgi:cytoskeletal protein CcmA (bactofilin family)
MFGNSKNASDTKTSTTSSPSASASGLNALVKGTSVEGNIKCESDLRIDGTIKGKLHCKAKVIIGPTGAVEGEIICQNAVIEGRFKGTLSVSELLNVRETAEVDGDISTNKLIVQSGARFNVACKMEVGVTNGTTKNIDRSNETATIAAGKATANN